MFEIRSNFIVKGISGGEEFIDSERYAIAAVKHEFDNYLQFFIGLRLKDYWIPDDQIRRRLIHDFVDFAKQIPAPGIIPAAVDLDVCTVQSEGEEIIAAEARAMRPELLPPLYLYPTVKRPGDKYYNGWHRQWDMSELVAKLKNVRVEDVSSAAIVRVMEVCGVCGKEPLPGTQISTIRCGHAFHYHCIVTRLEEKNSCPVCNQSPAFDEAKSSILKDLEADILFHYVDMDDDSGDEDDLQDSD